MCPGGPLDERGHASKVWNWEVWKLGWNADGFVGMVMAAHLAGDLLVGVSPSHLIPVPPQGCPHPITALLASGPAALRGFSWTTLLPGGLEISRVSRSFHLLYC